MNCGLTDLLNSLPALGVSAAVGRRRIGKTTGPIGSNQSFLLHQPYEGFLLFGGTDASDFQNRFLELKLW